MPQHPEADAKDDEACHDPEIGMNLLFRQVPGGKLRQKPQEDDAEGVGKGDDEAKNDGVYISSAGADQIGGNHRFSMPRFQGMGCTQKKGGNIDAEHPRTRYFHRTFP